MDPKKDRDKRTSFLDKIRIPGKEKKDKPKYQHNLPRPTSDDLSEVGEVETMLKELTENEINARFEQMLDDMNLTEDKKQPLRLRSIIEKRELLKNFLKHSGQGVSRFENPRDYIHALESGDLHSAKLLRCVESLRIDLTNKTVSWLKEFGVEGLNKLLHVLKDCYKSESQLTRSIQYECIKCLKAFMNNKIGLIHIFDHKEALILIARSIDPREQQIMTETVKILAAICLIPPDGHKKALEAVTIAGEMEGKDRFLPIIGGLKVKNLIYLGV